MKSSISNGVKQGNNPLPVPAVKHMYAESLLIYRLVKWKNTMSVKFPLVEKSLTKGVTH